MTFSIDAFDGTRAVVTVTGADSDDGAELAADAAFIGVTAFDADADGDGDGDSGVGACAAIAADADNESDAGEDPDDESVGVSDIAGTIAGDAFVVPLRSGAATADCATALAGTCDGMSALVGPWQAVRIAAAPSQPMVLDILLIRASAT